ncbi:MAG: c-type cytochrome domain-containing protein [Bryobacteraceae bacterium]
MHRSVIPLLALTAVAVAQTPSKEDARFFDKRVAPILSKRCLGCHNQELNDGGISFLDRETLIRGGSRGPAIIPGDPERSLLIHAIRRDGDLMMPPGTPLTPRDVATLAEWIKRGAPWGTKLRAQPKSK